jgi:Histidine kinase-, DNA gyrase B-, and HSP90-like ATPase
LDKTQQTITVEDNAGGLPKADLRFVVGPGETGTNPTDETIGIFGVGTKRAVVALAQDVKITTRFRKHQIDFDDNWLKDDDWELPIYEEWLKPVIEFVKKSGDEDFLLNKLVEITGVGQFKIRVIPEP